MRFVLVLAALLLTLSLVACGSEDPTATTPPLAPDPTATPSPTATSPAPTATPASPVSSTPVPTPDPGPTDVPHGGNTGELSGDPVEGGVLKLLGSDPPTLDPHQTGDVTSSRYILEVFGGLLTIDPDLVLVTDLAQDWSVDPNGQGYTFRLNPDATFHDGRKVTATDFKWSLERASDPETEAPAADTFLGDIVGAKDKLNGNADSIAGISVVDEETLRIDVDAPKAYFLSKLSYPTSFVVDRANVETGRDWVRTPNGTGPFMLAEYDPGEFMRLERFDSYHLGPAMIDAVEFNLAGGQGLLMYENDELHLGQVGVAALERFHDPSDPLHDQLHQGPPQYDTAYIGLSSVEPPFDDPLVRQALNYAVDRETITEVLLEDAAVPARGILPPGFPGYNPDVSGYEYNPDRARELLAQSTYGDDPSTWPTMTITIPGSFGSSPGPITEVILKTWEEQLGVQMDILQTEWATYLQDLQEGRFQIFGGLGWVADYADPENFLDVLFHSESSNNHTHYSDPSLDDLLERARVEQDRAARFAMYNEAEQMILDGSPWIPLYHSAGEHYLIKPYVQGFPISSLVIPRFRFVYFIE